MVTDCGRVNQLGVRMLRAVSEKATDEPHSNWFAAGIIADPQAHIDALVKAGVLRRQHPISGAYYAVVPPTCPTCGK